MTTNPPQVTLARRAYFSAARRLFNPAWSHERNCRVFGPRCRAHGHDYILDVFYRGTVSDEDGMIVNLDRLKPVLAELAARLEGEFLEELEPFRERRPSLENLVNFIWCQLPPDLDAGRLQRVRLAETSRLWATKAETDTGDTMRLTRAYEFAAAHRLHAPRLSEQDNQQLYGKCNNPCGHGHNYGLEVTIEGEPNPETGALLPLEELDQVVEREVFARFDHRHLNDDCPDFVNLIPTSENLARVIFKHLQACLPGCGVRLARVGLHETQKNYFEVEA